MKNLYQRQKRTTFSKRFPVWCQLMISTGPELAAAAAAVYSLPFYTYKTRLAIYTRASTDWKRAKHPPNHPPSFIFPTFFCFFFVSSGVLVEKETESVSDGTKMSPSFYLFPPPSFFPPFGPPESNIKLFLFFFCWLVVVFFFVFGWLFSFLFEGGFFLSFCSSSFVLFCFVFRDSWW